MVRKNIPVNDVSGMILDSVGERIRAERTRLGKTIVDFALQCGVTKQTQIKYEGNQNHPDTRYLDGAMRQGADIMYILTGERSPDAPLTPELQNLLEAYEASPVELKRAVFGVLLSPYKAEWDKSRVVPGYFRHQILGEDDTRFEDHYAKQRTQPAKTDKQTLTAEETALLDNYRNMTPDRQAALREAGATLEKPLTNEGDVHCA